MTKVTIDAKCTMSNGVIKDKAIKVHMEYDEEEDPLSYGVIFEVDEEEETFWIMGRDLFIDALREGQAGFSDILIIDTGDYLGLTLMVEDANAVILLPIDDIQSFVSETTRLIPQGREDVNDQIEELLEEIFE